MSKSKKKFAKKRLFLAWFLGFFFFLFITFSHPSFVKGETLESSSYIIQFGNFNMSSGEQTGDNYAVSNTLGGNFVGPYGEYGVSNYFLGSGFQYIYQLRAFRFALGSTLIDLGLLTASAHNTASHDIEITAPGAGGYSIYAYEQHPLQTQSGSSAVADTTCDNNDCDETAAKEWQNPDIGGFGFNVDGDDVATDFLTTNFFRQFANKAGDEEMQVIMSSPSASFDRSASVTYKAGLKGSEAAGRYQTSVVYIAVPGY